WTLNLKDWLILSCIALLMLMDGFNATVLIPILPDLSNSLDTPFSGVLWCQTAYLLVNAVSHCFFTMLLEIFGHGSLLFSALILSTVGTGIGCRAGSLSQLIAGRILQGIAGGGMTSVSLLLISDVIPPCKRPVTISYLFIARVIGAIFGPVAGGIFVDRASWSWAFYINFILCALGIVLVPFTITFQMNRTIDLRRIRTMDWSGATLIFLSVGTLLIGISWGGTLYPWHNWRTLLPIAAGGAGILALIFYERVWAVDPHFKLTVLQSSRSSIAAYIGCFLQGILIFTKLQYLALYLLSVGYMTPTFAGLSLLAITAVIFPTAAMEGTLTAKSRRFHWSLWAGWMMTILSTGCFILLSASIPTGGWVIMFIVAGMGHGLLISGYNICLHAWTNEEESHHAMKMYSLLRTLGMCVAVPVAGCILLNQVVHHITQLGLQAGVVNTANGYIILLSEVELSKAERAALDAAYTASFRFLWQVMSGVAALGGLSSFFI
ncbi:hypothetical protein ASPZODRAFT_30537, partial [Penicilliopsis zonata CBS 506.65]